MVREIIDPIPTAVVAGARAFLSKVINVRGNVIPLADLRIRFGMPANDGTADTRIVVVELDIDGDPVQVGVLADKVYEVTEILPADVQQTPSAQEPELHSPGAAQEAPSGSLAFSEQEVIRRSVANPGG